MYIAIAMQNKWNQDTRLCVSGQESRVVQFTEIANLPFSTPHISITTMPISIKLTYFMSSIYTTLHTKLEENWHSSSQDMCS